MLSEMIIPLVRWYRISHRDLPWRQDATAYHVWLSEIMLQQTRVEAVKPYYAHFLQEFPTIRDLANAPEERLLKAWEGLGYYSRVRNLQKAAITIERDYQGSMPDTFEDLLGLQGIGRYTAGAISSICFGRYEPAVDGNVLRVLARLRADDRCISDSKVKLAVEAELRCAMNVVKDRGDDYAPGDLNQALMELGACVCIPNGMPLCDTCPLAFLCKAKAHGTVKDYPVKAEKKPRKIEERTILVLSSQNTIAIHKRPERGLLAGLYELISLAGHCSEQEAADYCRSHGLVTVSVTPLPPAKHIFTHIEWHMKGYRIEVIRSAEEAKGKVDYPAAGRVEGLADHASEDWIWVSQDQLTSQYAIPSAFEAYLPKA